MVTVFLGGENHDGDVKIIVPILLMGDDLRHLPDEERVSLPVREAGRSYHHLNTQAVLWIRCGSGSGILGQSGSGSGSRDMMSKIGKFLAKNFLCDQKLQIIYPSSFMKVVQATG
jgi:hypothetical protein